jgi:hypothetical protein
MKEIKSLMSMLGMMAIAFVGLHYLILLTGLNDLAALILFALPLAIMIAYSTEDSAAEMARSSIIIYAWFSAVVLAAAGLVRVID